jgi:hypothetical protein
MNNWERLTLKLLGLKLRRIDHTVYPSWLLKTPSDILNVYGSRYLVIR